MQLYRVVNTFKEEVTAYHGTRDAAHEDAKDGHLPADDDYRIDLVDVPTDKASLLQMLNSMCYDATDGRTSITIERTWRLTPRGGLKEVANGE